MMMAAVGAAVLAGFPAAAGDDPLGPLGFLVGSCWKGEFPGSNGTTDTHCFEAVYGGRLVRDRHVVEGAGPAYRGESLYRWDAAAGSIRYAYDASDGGHSEGTLRAVEGGLAFDDRYLGSDGKPLVLRGTWMREGADGYTATTEVQEAGGWRAMWKVPFRRVVDGPAEGAVSAEFPDVRDLSYREADGSGVIRVTTTVRAPAERVWAAMTSAEGWRRWAVKQAWVDFRIGGMIETSYDEAAAQGRPGNIKNRIEAFIPGRMLTIRNVQAPPGFANAEEFGQTVTVIELTPNPDGSTLVSVTGVGFRPGAAFDDLFGKFRMGNSWTLQSLKRALEAG
jgi:uncharacterized protein YndB with AHSA1/START domain